MDVSFIFLAIEYCSFLLCCSENCTSWEGLDKLISEQSVPEKDVWSELFYSAVNRTSMTMYGKIKCHIYHCPTSIHEDYTVQSFINKGGDKNKLCSDFYIVTYCKLWLQMACFTIFLATLISVSKKSILGHYLHLLDHQSLPVPLTLA